jgi:hypothetical protein
VWWWSALASLPRFIMEAFAANSIKEACIARNRLSSLHMGSITIGRRLTSFE